MRVRVCLGVLSDRQVHRLTSLSQFFARQLAGLRHPIDELSLVERVVLVDVEEALKPAIAGLAAACDLTANLSNVALAPIAQR